MKAIILAAGQGARLRPLTDDRPKCMVEYRGKPIIDYILEAFNTCSIKDITLVKGYKADVLNRPGTKSYINENFETTNMVSTLFCAENELNDDIIISYADIIYSHEILQKLIDCKDDLATTIDLDWQKLWSARMEDPLTDAETMKLDSQGFITELGKKPKSLDEIQGQYMGLIKISGKVITKVRNFYHGLDSDALYDGKDFANMYMTSFLQLIIDNLQPIRAVPVRGGWLEVDCPTDLELQSPFLYSSPMRKIRGSRIIDYG